jgi:hypothetical protein
MSIAATKAHRSAVALAVASGTVIPAAAFVAFGSGDTPYNPDTDVSLEDEFFRVAAINSTDGPQLTVRGTLQGIDAGANITREVAVFASDGTLMGRKVIAPKELEPESSIEFEIVFEY